MSKFLFFLNTYLWWSAKIIRNREGAWSHW